MSKKIFISYSHKQFEWVHETLVPVIKACGAAEVFTDKEYFEAGKSVKGQMDAVQDKAKINIIVLSPEYLQSSNCQHEMRRAIKLDPEFKKGIVVPVVRKGCNIPPEISNYDPLHIDLSNAKKSDQWNLLMDACKVSLRADVPNWLDARNDIIKYLNRKESVSFVLKGDPEWRYLIKSVYGNFTHKIGAVDLDSGSTASRRGLVTEILNAFGSKVNVPDEPEDLVTFDQEISKKNNLILAFTHFDNITRPQYNSDLFKALRHLLSDKKKMTLFTVSHKPFTSLIPKDNDISNIPIKTVELGERR